MATSLGIDALVLLLIATCSFMWVFIAIGLTSKSAQAANGTATLLVVPLDLVSAAYVPRLTARLDVAGRRQPAT
jgi:hypothetical protein